MFVEFPATGGLLTSWEFETTKLLRFVSSYDYFVFGCQIVYAIFIIYYTIEECFDVSLSARLGLSLFSFFLKISYNKWKYFKDIYNILDMTIIILSYVAIPFGYYRDWKVNDELSSSLLDERIFLNLNTLDAWTNTLDKLNAVILL